MKKIRNIILTALTLLFLMPTNVVNAAQPEGSVDYSVTPVLPSNQQKRGNSFFDLLVKPGTKQTIKVQINNFSTKAEKYNIAVNTAETNGNMIIDYGIPKVPPASVNPTPISKYVKYPKQVTVPAKKTGQVSIEIDVPQTAFTGIMLGGIHVKKDFSAAEKKQKAGVLTEYDYMIALLLMENTKVVVAPQLVFKHIKPAVINKNAGLHVQLENTKPINIKSAHMVANFYEKSNLNKAVMTRTIDNGGIAPNSRFDINIFNGESGATRPLKAGKYLMKMTVQDAAGRKWVFNEDFEITEAEAKSVNNDVFTVKNETPLWIYILIGVLIALILIVLLILLLRRKKDKDDDRGRGKKNSGKKSSTASSRNRNSRNNAPKKSNRSRFDDEEDERPRKKSNRSRFDEDEDRPKKKSSGSERKSRFNYDDDDDGYDE